MISRDNLSKFAGAASTAVPANNKARGGGFDMESFISKHGIEVVRRKTWNSHPGGQIYELAHCLFNQNHTGGSAALTTENGKPGYRCQHAGCQGKTIKDVFPLYPPDQTGWHAPHYDVDWEVEGKLNTVRATPPPVPMLDGYLVYKTNYPPPVFLFHGLLANGLNIIAGRPKSGKSWLTLQMAIDAAMRRHFLRRFGIDQAVSVLYCGLEEGPQRTHNRLRKFLENNDIQLQNIDFLYSLKPLAEGWAAELDGLLSKKIYGLVVIDTFLRIAKPSGGNSNVMRSEYAEIAQLHELAQKYELAMVLVHHTRKMTAENGLDMVAGTTGITAACDAVWTLRKTPGGESVLEITGREMEEQTLGLRLADDEGFGWHLTGEGAEVGMSEARQEIVELLKDDAPLSPKAIALSLRRNAVTIRRLLQKMLADGVVQRGRDGKYFLTPCEQRERVNGVNAVDNELRLMAVGGVWLADNSDGNAVNEIPAAPGVPVASDEVIS